MSRTSVTIGIALLIAVGIGFIVLRSQENDTLPIQNEFPTKVIYTLDLGTDKEPLIQDCRERDGEFNECGTACEPEAEVCDSVCAYTCEDIRR